MTQPLRILNLEDNKYDSELIQQVLTEDGIACSIVRVDSRDTFLEALRTLAIDLILSDYNLPSFDGLTALSLAKEISPHVPMIYVSGTIGEERAIDALKRGATDYVLKDRIARLPSVVRRALRDKEERHKQRLNEEQIRLQAELLDIDPDGIIVMDTTGKIKFWSKGSERLYGFSKEEIIGKRSTELSKKDLPVQYDEALQSVLTHGRWEGEWTHILKDGHELTVYSRWLLMRDDDGNPQSIYVVDSDITEKKRLEAQFLRSQRMESIGTLAGGIAHDLNNVLGPIMIALQLLRKKLPLEEDQKMVNMLEAVTKRGADMVKHILTFARGVERKKIEIQPKHLVLEIEQMVRETFPKNIDFQLKVSSQPWNTTGDPTQFNQVLLNLCVNARDAMPSGGLLTVTIDNVVVDEHTARFHTDAKPGPHVMFIVADTGVGIPHHLLEKIYEPFYTTKGPGKGTGLGLSTSYGIVRSHGGFMSVYSEVGKGTEFKVYLPAVPSAATEKAEGESRDLPTGSGQTILIIDDETSILEITKTMLESFNYRVLTAADGAEGVVVTAKHSSEINAIVCDMNMPLMDGMATIRAIRKILPTVKIIAASGFLRHEHVIELESGEHIAFLQKPYPAEKLLTMLAEMFGK
ncbi:MAG: response regulator [Ignavibacteriae bacterium]|nr:response regulator [Ignavibacteriota bacterium]